MNGRLSEHPLAELIHEISAKSLSGRMQLQHDRIKVAVYFEGGELQYAASNARNLRVREYILQAGIAEAALAGYGQRSDFELVKALSAERVLTSALAEQIQTKQVGDILRLALSWVEGSWDFDPRALLDGAPIANLDTRPLLLEAARRTPAQFAAARFENREEMISVSSTATDFGNVLPAEVFILSRLDRPTVLNDLLAVSGVAESEALVHLYSLVLAGLVQRQNWKYVLGGPVAVRPTAPVKAEPPPPGPVEEERDEIAEAQRFLEQLSHAQTHYDVLDAGREETAEQMKLKYYELARRYHPDRFRRADAALVRRLESAFARVAQAYDTLRDDRLRANYDAKLLARQKAQQLAESAPKPTAPAPEKPAPTTETASEAKTNTA